MFDESKKVVPTVRGFAVGEKFYFECSFCQKFHSFGIPTEGTGRGKLNHGHRNAHCSKNTPYTGTGYNLKAYTKSELQQIKRWAEEALES